MFDVLKGSNHLPEAIESFTTFWSVELLIPRQAGCIRATSAR